jgi:two-component system chemotaxis sensor kinase CheA
MHALRQGEVDLLQAGDKRQRHGLELIAAGATAAATAAGRALLLVDDSAFFRNLLTPVLSVAGWQVTAAEGPHEALKLRDDGRVFDVIVSDIEMPRMDGIAFALDVRADARWKDTPMVALSTRVEKEIIAQALKSGFDTYVAKSDRDTLLNTLAGLIAGEPDAESTAHAAGDDQSHRAA